MWKCCGKAQFPQNFHTMKLGKITVFYAVVFSQKRVLDTLLGCNTFLEIICTFYFLENAQESFFRKKILPECDISTRWIIHKNRKQVRSIKVRLSTSKKVGFICFNESPLKWWINFKIYDVTVTNILADISKIKDNQLMKFNQLI